LNWLVPIKIGCPDN
jgi:hypothetical protein